MSSLQTQAIETLISPAMAGMGYDVVRVKMFGASRPTLQVMVERQDAAAMTVEDCALISRTVSALLDVEDPITSSYTLEVSSPGLDRPLLRPADYDKFTGLEAKIELRGLLDGQRRFRGVLAGFADDLVNIVTKDGTKALPYEDIDNAKLIITDELLAAGTAEAAKQGQA